MRFSPENPPSHEILCRPAGLVGPKISFSLEEPGVGWSERRKQPCSTGPTSRV